MVDSITVLTWLWYGSIALLWVLAIRMVLSGLWNSYVPFTLYILSLATESVVLLDFSRDPDAYGKVWSITRSICLVFEFWLRRFPEVTHLCSPEMTQAF